MSFSGSRSCHFLGEPSDQCTKGGHPGNQLSFFVLVCNLTRLCRFLLYNINRIQPFLFTVSRRVLAQSLIFLKFDCCSSPLPGLPSVHKLHKVPETDAAACLAFNLPLFPHISHHPSKSRADQHQDSSLHAGGGPRFPHLSWKDHFKRKFHSFILIVLYEHSV